MIDGQPLQEVVVLQDQIDSMAVVDGQAVPADNANNTNNANNVEGGAPPAQSENTSFRDGWLAPAKFVGTSAEDIQLNV